MARKTVKEVSLAQNYSLTPEKLQYIIYNPIPEIKTKSDLTKGVTKHTEPAPQSLDDYFSQLEEKIKNAYESTVTISEAETLAAQFLHALIQVNKALDIVDLDRRMRKTGVKAVRAAVLLENVKAADKKPADSILDALVDVNKVVQSEQDAQDKAETKTQTLNNYFKIFTEAHTYFRQKGNVG